MIINNSNIEELMFDYFEGNLSPTEMSSLESFVASNPEFKEDFDAWKGSFVKEEEKDFPLASDLLAGSGAIWQRWAIGLLLLIGFGSLAYIGVSNYYSTIDNDISQVKQKENLGLKTDKYLSRVNGISIIAPHLGRGKGENSTNTIEVSKSTEFTTNQGLSSNSSKETNSLNKEENNLTNNYQSNKANRKLGHKAISSASGSKNEKVKIASSKNHENDEYVAELSPYENPGYGMSYHKNSDNALLEAVNYFKDNRGANANNKNYKGTMDDFMEKQRVFDNRISFIKKVINKIPPIIETVEHSASNFKDPYFAISEFKGAINTNPSFVGSKGVPRIKISARNAGGALSYNENQLGVYSDFYIKKLRTGFGFIGEYNNFNDILTHSKVGLIISPKIKINKNVTIDPSISYSYNQTNLDFNKVTGSSFEFRMNRLSPIKIAKLGNNQLDLASTFNSYSNLDFGLMLNTRGFFIGANINNTFTPDAFKSTIDVAEYYQLKRRFSAQAGSDFKLSQDSKFILSPYAIFNLQGNYNEFWFGSTFKANNFILGASINNHKDYTGMIGLEGNLMRLSYSYEKAFYSGFDSKISAHNLSLRILIAKRRNDNEGYLQY